MPNLEDAFEANRAHRAQQLAANNMQQLIDVAQASAVPLAEVVEGYKSLTGLIADRDAEVALADRLANTGHHAEGCQATMRYPVVTLNGNVLPNVATLVINGVDHTESLRRSKYLSCSCGWSDALKAWRERRDE